MGVQQTHQFIQAVARATRSLTWSPRLKPPGYEASADPHRTLISRSRGTEK